MAAQNYYYHYTNIVGLMGIINSKSLWFTDHAFLNDKHEIKKGLTSLLSHFSAAEQKSFMLGFDFHNWHTRYCIVSLSKSYEILSQWRAYADDGKGVAIGFSKQLLADAGVKYKECIYSDHDEIAEALAGKHEQFIKSVAENWEKFSEMSLENFDRWVVENKSKFIEVVEDTMNLKNSSFESEQEIRGILAVDRTEMKNRVSGNLIIPYTEKYLWGKGILKFRGEEVIIGQVIHQVWLGPKCNDLNKLTINMLGIDKCHVEKYDCGYV
ncbi:MAG: hypothetical protein methR_P3336 [Methyloprofundus sp.]|nr:MAG: hypothetical protein methR_P3336 [Methyloprofundus sp.]